MILFIITTTLLKEISWWLLYTNPDERYVPRYPIPFGGSVGTSDTGSVIRMISTTLDALAGFFATCFVVILTPTVVVSQIHQFRKYEKEASCMKNMKKFVSLHVSELDLTLVVFHFDRYTISP
jgi:hypothetical protein